MFKLGNIYRPCKVYFPKHSQNKQYKMKTSVQVHFGGSYKYMQQIRWAWIDALAEDMEAIANIVAMLDE